MRKTLKIAVNRETLRRLDHDVVLRGAAGGVTGKLCSINMTCNGASICEITCPVNCHVQTQQVTCTE